jgi:hypothetical protein
MELGQFGRLIFFAGIALVALGALIVLLGRLPFFGSLPGDITIRRGNTTVFIPIATMILLSLLLTVILNLVLRR